MITNNLASGVYTFRLCGTNEYLRAEGNKVTAGGAPYPWVVKPCDRKYCFIYADASPLLLDIDNAYIAEGTTVKAWPLTGFLAQSWSICENGDGTYSFLASENADLCLGFSGGRASLHRRRAGDPRQSFHVQRITNGIYSPFVSEGGVIELQLPTDITRVISAPRLQKWANDLERAYYSFYELTGYLPYDRVTVEAYLPSQYTGYVMGGQSVIHIDSRFIQRDLAKMAVRDNDWNFCALHEMGHLFDTDKPWTFEGEAMTDIKVAYVLEVNGACANLGQFEAECFYRGADIDKAYVAMSGDLSRGYDIFACAHRFLQIKADIGWEPFRKAFHTLQKNSAGLTSLTRRERLETFTGLLYLHSGVNVKEYFSSSEWNSIITETEK